MKSKYLKTLSITIASISVIAIPAALASCSSASHDDPNNKHQTSGNGGQMKLAISNNITGTRTDNRVILNNEFITPNANGITSFEIHLNQYQSYLEQNHGIYFALVLQNFENDRLFTTVAGDSMDFDNSNKGDFNLVNFDDRIPAIVETGDNYYLQTGVDFQDGSITPGFSYDDLGAFSAILPVGLRFNNSLDDITNYYFNFSYSLNAGYVLNEDQEGEVVPGSDLSADFSIHLLP